ncbi:hypothetical protein VNO77_00244 [Canavalia gladiata]|uniref:Uncharacterized protein n=1 Tax=Canavalia gladiata TaxID=3824 RepID=A0AAN9MPP2_CANGL
MTGEGRGRGYRGTSSRRRGRAPWYAKYAPVGGFSSFFEDKPNDSDFLFGSFGFGASTSNLTLWLAAK